MKNRKARKPGISAIKKTDKLRGIIVDDELSVATGPVYTSVDEIPFLYNDYHKFLAQQEVIDWFVEQGYKLKECSKCHDKFPDHIVYFRLRKDTDKLETQCRCCVYSRSNNETRRKRMAAKVIGSEAFIHDKYLNLKSHHISSRYGGVSFPIETFMSKEHLRKIVADAYDPETKTFKCGYTGVELVCSEGNSSSNSPTIDRIDNTKGYEEGNVILVSYDANTRKGSSTEEEQEKLIQGIKDSK